LLDFWKIMRKPILTIFYQFDPWKSSIGGIQTVVRNFIKFAPPEFKVRLVGITSSANGEVDQWQTRELAGQSVEFFPLFRLLDDDKRRLVPTTLRYAMGLWGKDFSSDFMHFHRLEPAIAARRWAGHKTLFVHNDIHQQIKASDARSILWQRFPQFYFAFEQQLISQFDQVLSCNSESTRLYQKQYPELADRISFVRNSFDGDVFYPLSLVERNESRRQRAIQMELREDTQFLLFAGRLHPQKDPLLLLDSLALVADPRAHLLVVGDGELRSAMIEKAMQLEIAHRVTFLGPLSYQDLADLNRLASVFVLTSAYEGLPLVVLEALACGTPVVTTRTGETPLLLRENCGVVCQERTPTEIAKALESVLQSPEHFPSYACVENATPYSAKYVIESVYADMLRQWEPNSMTWPNLCPQELGLS
jgi:glycosyltransferase involved in cell wall biosynthesis